MQQQQQRRLNELELDDAWQRGVVDRLLAPILREHSYRNQVIFLDCKSSVATMLQKRAHVDVVAQLPHGGTMSVEIKCVRWPGAKRGQPSHTHYSHLFLETESSHALRSKGWMHTSQADILLWCQCSLCEDRLDCWPFSFSRLRTWFIRHVDQMREVEVPNVIDGRALRTRGRLASITTVCRETKTEGFRITAQGLVSDLYGEPILDFMQDPAANISRRRMG
jgi:hypothetical protein